jgi:hypothetical protein
LVLFAGDPVLNFPPIKVSLSICDLPEVKEKILKRMAEYHKKFASPDIHQAKKSALK